jgi:glutamate racemase
MNSKPSSPIGLFDSGVGGLSVLRAIREHLPGEDLIYFGDQAHVPYGLRTIDQIRDFSVGITEYLLSQGAKMIVVACNTASAAALKYLRTTFSDTLFVGMEPAVKPAVETTRSRKVGVLATPATFQGGLYASVVERFANDVELFPETCPGLVTQIENGELDSQATDEILHKALDPLLDNGIDTIVLGCTHYPFVIPQIERIVGPEIQVIDPAPAIARRVSSLLDANRIRNTSDRLGKLKVITSGSPDGMQSALKKLLNLDGEVNHIPWITNRDLKNTPL